MSQPKRYMGGMVSVFADEDGKPHCAVCEQELRREGMAMLLMDPVAGIYDPYCKSCSVRIIANAAASIAMILVSKDADS